AFGFFTRLSAHLHHRIYFTPGFHFGQFADFPVGFGNGSAVPANFGELTPVKRWTTRFGFAITFKTKDFSGLTQSSTPTVKSGDSSATPKPTATPSPTPSPEAATLNSQLRADSATASFSGAQYSTLSDTPMFNTVAANSANSRRSEVRVTSINSAARSGEDRVVINADRPLNDYAVYFKNGRFYLVIPRGRLDGVEDGLRGRLFGDAMVEKHGDDLILSFLLQLGVRASVAERGDGLDLIFVLAGNDRDRASSGLAPIAP